MAAAKLDSMILDFDVLFAVMKQVKDIADVARMMRSCRAMLDAGLPLLFGRQVHLSSFNDLISFSQFMYNKTPSRYPLLVDLSLDIHDPVPDIFKALDIQRPVYALYQNLDSLISLRLIDVGTLWADKRIRQQLFSLTRLTRLSLSDPDKTTLALLSKLKAPLTVLELYSSSTFDGMEDPGALLRRAPFKDTLLELHTTRMEFSNTSSRFPHLRVLVADRATYTSTKRMGAVFPALEELTITLDDDIEDEEHPNSNMNPEDYAIDETDDFLAFGRVENLDEQDGRAPWSTLRCVKGSLLAMYQLALVGKIPRLDMRSTSLRTAHGPRLREIFEITLPTTLALRINVSAFDLAKLGELLGPAAESLTALELELLVSHEDPSPAITTLVLSLASFPIQSLHLEVKWIYSHGDAPIPTSGGEAPSPEPSPTGHFNPPLSTPNPEALAQEAMRAIPSLMRFSAQLDKYHKHAFEFRSTGDGANRHITQLSHYIA